MARIKPFRASLEPGALKERSNALFGRLERCDLCPRKCHVNRIDGQVGYCRAGGELEISSFTPHFGEEPPLVGRHGSGTIFLTHCSLRCIFCQNYEISALGVGEVTTSHTCSKMMLGLQGMGCHNINLVTPTLYAPHLIDAISIASEKGLDLPIVWNCGGYESADVIRDIDGIVDIYMPDFKFHSSEASFAYTGAGDYHDRCMEALSEMHRQVGDLKIQDGLAYRGLLIRHLVMPGMVEDSKRILEDIASISKGSYVNIMSQYKPHYKACEHPEINRPASAREVIEVKEYARSVGLFRIC